MSVWTDRYANAPVGNPLDRDWYGALTMVLAGSLLVFLRRNIGVRLLVRRWFVIAAVVLYCFSRIETPFDEFLAYFGVTVVVLGFFHHWRHMRRIKRGNPEWHSYDTGKSLLLFFVPLPKPL